MGTIPDDIFRAAADVWSALPKESAGIIAIARAILSERERHQWQPIDTAPNQEMVLVCDVNWPASLQRDQPPPIKVGYLDASMGTWKIFGASWRPTHWQPLPSPPTTEEGE